jgi:hypothetical protein
MENEFKRFFEVGVSYIDAIEKKHKETFIVKAISFAEAEDKAYLDFKDYAVTDIDVLSVKISNVTEVILDENDEKEKYYKVKYSTIVLDEKSAKEKRIPHYLLFNASSIDEAREMYKRESAGWVSDIILESITETKITAYLK